MQFKVGPHNSSRSGVLVEIALRRKSETTAALLGNRGRGVNLVKRVSVTIQGGTHVACIIVLLFGVGLTGIYFDASGQPQLPDPFPGPDIYSESRSCGELQSRPSIWCISAQISPAGSRTPRSIPELTSLAGVVGYQSLNSTIVSPHRHERDLGTFRRCRTLHALITFDHPPCICPSELEKIRY
jgi:hypothetical protein